MTYHDMIAAYGKRVETPVHVGQCAHDVRREIYRNHEAITTQCVNRDCLKMITEYHSDYLAIGV